MADDDASVASRTTLSSLPLEIKARICELAALQDERYKERWVKGALGEELVKVHTNEWRGRSLAALSETSKEFNELAAKHIFHTLNDTQIDSLEFTIVVLAQHSFRVRRVLIRGQPGGITKGIAAAQRVFAALPLLPNLSHLHTTWLVLSRALGNLQQPPESGRLGVIRNAFRPVARRLRTVELVNFPTADSTISFLETCEGLRDVTISGLVLIDDDEDLLRLSEHLSTISTLERLALDATIFEARGLHLPSGWHTINTLVSLSLINVELDATSVALINQHALTLRHLTLRLPDDSPPTPLPDLPTLLPLPHLSSFNLQNTSPDSFKAILAAVALATRTSATTSSESGLHHLTVELKAGLLPFDHVKGSLRPFATLHSLHVIGESSQYGTLRSLLEPFERMGILSAGSRCSDAFTYFSESLPKLLARYPTHEGIKGYVIASQRDSLREALTHGEQLVERYFQEGNTEGMAVMLKSMGNIWGDKLLQDD